MSEDLTDVLIVENLMTVIGVSRQIPHNPSDTVSLTLVNRPDIWFDNMNRSVAWIAAASIQLLLFSQVWLISKSERRKKLYENACSVAVETAPLLVPTNPLSTLELGSRAVRRQLPASKYVPPSVYPMVNMSVVNELTRAFPVFPEPFPCFPPEDNWKDIDVQRKPTDRGFFYFKARKAGSSTLAGVALRIAQTQAAKNNNNNMTMMIKHRDNHNNFTHCHTRYGHPSASRLRYHKRKRRQSFLWTVLREPTQRQLSEFFHFGVSRGHFEPTLYNFRYYTQELTPMTQSYYLQFLTTPKPYSHDHGDPISAVARILGEYDFIGITERLLESLAVLQVLLKLDTSQLLFLSAKTKGGFDDGVYNKQCTYIQPRYQSPQFMDYLNSHEWHNFTRGDNLLYATVNKSLDRTIESIGKDLVESNVNRLKWALDAVQSKCGGKVTFPCSSGGAFSEENDCLIWDSGCGYECINRVAVELGIQ